jgi:hypothetical protein
MQAKRMDNMSEMEDSKPYSWKYWFEYTYGTTEMRIIWHFWIKRANFNTMSGGGGVVLFCVSNLVASKYREELFQISLGILFG